MKLNYKEFGEGRPMIILHGLLGSLDNWQTLARKFSNNFKVYTVDQRNHGQSPHSGEMNYELLSEDLAEFISDHEIEKPILIGHSMGGKTVMKYTLDHPIQVSELIVVDMSPREYPVQHDHIMEALKLIDFKVIKTRSEAEEILMKELRNLGVVQFLSKNIYWKEKDELAFRFNLDVLFENLELISGWPFTTNQFLGNTLFIKANKANYIGENEPNIEAYFPNAKILGIDAGHWVHAEKPEEFYQAAMSFL